MTRNHEDRQAKTDTRPSAVTHTHAHTEPTCLKQQRATATPTKLDADPRAAFVERHTPLEAYDAAETTGHRHAISDVDVAVARCRCG